MRPLLSIVCFALGSFLCLASATVMQVPTRTNGPMNIDVSPLAMVVSGLLGLALLWLAGTTKRWSFGWMLLIVACLMFFTALYQTSLYPSIDGAYYLLRYGYKAMENLAPPSASSHIAVQFWITLFLYAGAVLAFPRAFSEQEQSMVHRIGGGIFRIFLYGLLSWWMSLRFVLYLRDIHNPHPSATFYISPLVALLVGVLVFFKWRRTGLLLTLMGAQLLGLSLTIQIASR